MCLAALTLFPKSPLSVGMKKSFADSVFSLLPFCYTSPSYPLLYSYIILACISPQDYFHEKAKPQLFYLGHVGIIYFMLGLHNSRGIPRVSWRLAYFRNNISTTVQLLESLLSTYAMNRQAAINVNFLEDVALWSSSTKDAPLQPFPCQSIDPFIEPKKKLTQQTWIKNLWVINYRLAATHGEIQSSMSPKDGSKQNANILCLENSLKLAVIERQLHLLGMGVDLKEGLKVQSTTKIQAPGDPNCTHSFILYLGILINIYCPYISMNTLRELDISYSGHLIADFINYIPEQKALIAVWHFCDAIRIHQSHFVATGLFYKWMNILNATFIPKHLSKSLPAGSLAAKQISVCINTMMSFLELGKARSHVARLSYEITLKVSSDKKVRIQILPNLCTRG
ncbi:hypothetical protein DSO57_1000038 [Entomophthora muscae]|uniref:Uncharacterized protein n=1 Tax=Entomophthora muscae TaxID=34485 RepID=A0ACC2SMJ0_9FUNG|nr:hypothetical protein DSO57_1000038 [Entomophthora muscae]